jgi:hypothetical protein
VRSLGQVRQDPLLGVLREIKVEPDSFEVISCGVSLDGFRDPDPANLDLDGP